MLTVLDNPLYYLDNFQRVLAWIEERYSDLLAEDEATLIARFPALPQPSRALFVRMVMRKGSLFRASKLHYDEIGDPDAAAAPLLAAGWIEADPALSLDELFDLLRKAELASVFHRLPAGPKAAQLEALRANHAHPRRFSEWHGETAEQVYRILNKPLCDRLRLIFFGNFQQDWSEFVLSDLGIYQYEQVAFSPASRGFRQRRDIDDYLALQRCRDRLGEGAAPAEVLAELAATVPDNDWLAGRRHKLLYRIAQQLEKEQDRDGAFAVYAACAHPGARLRAIRVLEKSGRRDEALAWLEKAEADPESEAERQQLPRIAVRLRRRPGHAGTPTPQTAPVHRLDIRLPCPAAPYQVEALVRDHLWREDAPVYYVENTLINSLFGLLCWEVIFKAIPGAFFHPFHRGPADLHRADFHQRRAADFTACLDLLDGDGYRAAILANYRRKYGLQSPFVAWDVLDPGLVELALDCIPPPHLRKWFERILADVTANRSGLPDLIRFWPAENRYQMIEVKGPGDRLQDNQKRWLNYRACHGMPVSVCYLQWQT